MINIEEILKKRIIKFPEDLENGMTDEAIRRNVKAAIKEIVEAVVDKCAEQAKTEFQSTWKQEDRGVQPLVDKDSILSVKQQVSYE